MDNALTTHNEPGVTNMRNYYITDYLFNTMVLNGLSASFEPFIVQETLAPWDDFVKLREGVRNYVNVRQLSGPSAESKTNSPHAAMAVKQASSQAHRPNVSTQRPKGNCFVCGVPGHYKAQCYKKDTASCSICKKKGHLAKALP